MKRFLYPLLVLLTILCLPASKAHASHCASSELLYEWVSDSTYRILWKFYRDCSGVPEDDTEALCITNTCNPSYNFEANLVKLKGYLPDGSRRFNGEELDVTCPGGLTTCAGGTMVGYREWWYSALITLPNRCSNWSFTVAPSARNSAVANLSSLGNLWTEATLDNLHFQGDSSPYFSVKPVPYVCNNMPYVCNAGAVDVNGDSMYFSLNYPSGAACGDSFGSNLDTFNNASLAPGVPRYNLVNNPLQCNNTFSLNHSNGEIKFTPNQTLVSELNVLVKTYRNGMYIGHIMRDIQVVVINCPNAQPSVKVNTTSITGGVLDANGNISVCAGNTLDFTFLASSDTGTTLSVRDNHNYSVPGSSVSYTGYYSDSVKGHFTWASSLADSGLKIFTVTVNDSSCRSLPSFMVLQTFTLPIIITPAIKAGHNATIVSGDTVHLNVGGRGSFTWGVLPGGAPVSSLSCTSCTNPVATPLVTTKYVVTTSFAASCKKTDTVTITVVPKAPVNEISGTVSINTASPNPSSPSCKVWLIVHTTSPFDSLRAIDSVTVAGSAYAASYQFLNKPAGSYLIKAALLNGTGSATGPVPTYFSSQLFWDSANSVVYSGTGQSVGNNINMRQGIVTSGPGFIGGSVTSGANKGTGGTAVANLLILLKNNSGQLVASTYTSSTGTYSFSNLSMGNYAVYPESEGYKTTPYNIMLSSVTPLLNKVNFIKHTISRVINPNTVGIENTTGEAAICIAPNPTKGMINVSWKQMIDNDASLIITDILGRKIIETKLVFNSGGGAVKLDLSSNQPGVYLVNIKGNTINYTNKIILQR